MSRDLSDHNHDAVPPATRAAPAEPTHVTSGTESGPGPDSRPITYGQIAGYVLACLAAWLLVRPYDGISFDGQLYALQVLSVLHPVPLAQDVFLRFGSQNDYTLFPHLVAPVARVFDIQVASTLATYSSALALLTAGWLLARRLASPPLAWLSLGLLVTLPGWYGAGDIFRYDEMYMSARVPAEALSVFALAAACRQRWVLSSACIAAAVAVHAVMALPALGLLILYAIDQRAGIALRGHSALLVAAVGTLCVAAAALLLAPQQSAEHEMWMEIMRSRTVYAFLPNWSIEDWFKNALGLTSLLLTARCLDAGLARRIAYLALLIGLSGLLLAGLPSLRADFELLLLGQTWRWLWLSRFVAVVLLPLTLRTLWRSDSGGRAAAVLLGSAWLLPDYTAGGIVAIASALVYLASSRMGARSIDLVTKGSWTVAIATLAIISVTAVQALSLEFDTNIAPIWVQRLMDVAGRPGTLALGISALWYALFMTSWSRLSLLAAVLAAIVLFGTLPYAYSHATQPRYGSPYDQAFADWRAVIPREAEVLFYEDPPLIWAVLERRSFMSISQSAGVMYSPAAAGELVRRSRTLEPLVSSSWWLAGRRQAGDPSPRKLTEPLLRGICEDASLDFVISMEQLGGYRLRGEWPDRNRFVYLYDCSRFRPQVPR
jgi:hypothetical protein